MCQVDRFEWLNSEEFDNLLYSYRTAPATNQALVIERFKAVINAIQKHAPDTSPTWRDEIAKVIR